MAAAKQTVCVQVGHRACPRPSAACPAGVDRAQLRDPRAARLSARRHPAAAGSAAAPRRRVHAAASAAMTKIDGFKVAVFSAQTFVEEFLRDPLEATFPENNLKVGHLYRTSKAQFFGGTSAGSLPPAGIGAAKKQMLPLMAKCGTRPEAGLPCAVAEQSLPPRRCQSTALFYGPLPRPLPPSPATPPPPLPQWIEARLDKETAELAHGHDAVCLFVNDACDAEVGAAC